MAAGTARIVGVGESDYARSGGIADRSGLALAFEAILAAARDCGLDPRQIDGFASWGNDPNLPAVIQHGLGAPAMRHASMVWGGGGGGLMAALGNAVAAVEGGAAGTVVLYRAIAREQAGRMGAGGRGGRDANFALPFGLSIPAQQAALMAQRHFHDHGTSAETLAQIAVTFRANARDNPRALMRGKPLDVQACLAARMIAAPLRLCDCCPESDGAAAAIVTTASRAADLARPAVAVLATVQGGGPGWGMGFAGGHAMASRDYSHGNAAALGRELFARAGVAPGDIAVAQFYDAFTPMVVQALGDYGFVDHDGVAAFVAAGALGPGGRLPANTAGGSLSEAYVQGANLLVEAVRQLRGEARRQVAGARLAFVAGGPGVAPTSAGILARV